MPSSFDPDIHLGQSKSEVAQIQSIMERLNRNMQRDRVVQDTTNELRNFFQVDRVALYYFYKQWEGRVTYESLSDRKFSVLGSTGPDQCFNGEYAALYLKGRVSTIADIETAEIAPCHRDFLREIGVRANLVAPILPQDETGRTLWGLLVAHHCQAARRWTQEDIERIEKGAEVLAIAPSIQYR